MTGGMLPPGMKPSGALTSRTPTLEERATDWLRKLLYTDDREGTRKAEKVLNTARVGGLVDLPFATYDMGKAGAEGDVPGALMSMILSVPGISKSTADDLFKMRGNRDLYEMFERTGYWLDPNYSIPKTMIGPKDNQDLFSQRFYEEINRLKRSPGDKVEKYIDLDAISQDPSITPTDFRVVGGVLPGRSTSTEGVFKPDFNQAIVFPDHIRSNLASKSERDQLNSIKGISLHELTHGSQHNAGQQDATTMDYFANYLENIFNGKTFPKDTTIVEQLIDIDEALPNFTFRDAVADKDFDADLNTNQHGVADFLSYWFHPSEREARASEDMLTRSLDDRAKSYLKGVDSMPPKSPYKSTKGLIDMLHKVFVTGELDASRHVRKNTKP